MDDFENKLTELHDRVLSKALTEDEQNSYTESLFESIKHINEYGEEFWYARELQRALEYTEWRNFSRVIDRAVTACENSGNDVFHHFVEVNKTIDMPKSATKEITDYALSRYACYLIVQNGDSRKKVIALGQTYFAVKTRQQELIDNFNELNEDQKRLAIRRENGLNMILMKWLTADARLVSVNSKVIFLDEEDNPHEFTVSDYASGRGEGTVGALGMDLWGLRILLLGDLSVFKNHIMTAVRIYTTDGYYDYKIKKGAAEKTRKAYRLFEKEIQKGNLDKWK